MTKTKEFPNVFFSPQHITEITQQFRSLLDNKQRENLSLRMIVRLPEETWEHDQEPEFFSDIRKEGATYQYRLISYRYDLIVDCDRRVARVVVAASERNDIEGVFQVIERLAPLAELPYVEEETAGRLVTVFIGHGRNLQWRDLKDHLHEKHGYAVEAYEIGARAGHAIRDVLEHMLGSSSIAFLVMTGEEETTAGVLHARQNVIHEIGLFQGTLGFAKAIVLMEEGAEEFSNINGIQQIRFARGGIRETFGDVVATIRREFPEGVT